MSGRRSGTNPANKITGSGKMVQQQLSHQKNLVEGSFPVDRRWGTNGYHTVQISIILTPLSEDLSRAMFNAFNRNQFRNYSRPWRTLQQPFQWRWCAKQLKICANALRPVSRLPVAIWSISLSRCRKRRLSAF